jgi:transglutaminase-like putative cysteine protease
MFARRTFIASGLAVSALALLPKGIARAAAGGFDPRPGKWRTFEITTQVDVRVPAGRNQAWVPLPSVSEAAWCRPAGNTWTTNAATATVERDPRWGAEMLHLVWKDGEGAPSATVVSRIATQDRAIDLSQPASAAIRLPEADRRLYLSATRLMPTDGIVKQVSDKITKGAGTDLDKVRAVYDWVVQNGFRDAKVKGCGAGDVVSMLELQSYGGKCADLNGLFVALVRAAGVPARDVYGIRVAPSQFGYKSLGANSETITGAQHCRAEVHLERFGWVPMDPADVRKVMLEEVAGGLPAEDARVKAARATLFGAWDGNWLAYNVAHDVTLPNSDEPPQGFLMYPEIKTGSEKLNCLNAGDNCYTIRTREIQA